MQYQSECFEALKSVSKVSKPFEKVLMDTLKLFMAIPGKVNFLQMGRYGEFSEQTYRNNFENEAFDWFAFNEYLVRKVLNGKFLAIAVDPSFLPKSGKKDALDRTFLVRSCWRDEARSGDLRSRCH